MSSSYITTDNKTKEQRAVEFINAIVEIEEAMRPYREQRSDLKKNYVENGWLSKEEMKALTKAYRLQKEEIDFGQLDHFYNEVLGGPVDKE
jgi:hypothetical protein